MPESPEPTALYRLYDADDQLLYVGIAKDPTARWESHARSPRSSRWWSLVERRSVEWYASREEADVAETGAIKAERPLHNRAKVPGVHFVNFRYFSPEIQWHRAPQDPVSEQAARILRAEIANNLFTSGDQMPTAKELHRRFGISDQTCGKMLQVLAKEGVIQQRRPGGRYYCA
ncbi:GntR family transcriptional regulator [Streptomyces sp. NPDC054840]